MRTSVATVVTLLVLAQARSSSAMGGTLNTPSIAVAAASGRDAKDWKAWLAVLADKKYQFIVGDFINSSTNLYYGGDTESLNDFLGKLSAVPGTTVRVSFSKETKTASSAFGGTETQTGPCHWQIQHLGYNPEEFHVTIYLGDGKIAVERLSLPAMRTPNTKPEQEKPGGK